MSHTEAHTKPIEHKHRWHNSENYILPTDDEESQRRATARTEKSLECDNSLIALPGRLVLCPLEVKSGDEVLDVGTGKAAWALDFLASYPNAHETNTKIVGIDISDRLFPQYPPPNISFQIQNVLNLPSDWSDRFSFVHQRLLMAALKKDEWDRAVKEVYRVTKDGGWAQFCESNAVSHMEKCGPASARFLELYGKMWGAAGLDPLCSLNIEPLMKQAGFVNVQTENRVVPLGEWYGDSGTKHKKNIMGVYRGFKTPILRLGGFGMVKSEEEFDRLMDEMEEEWTRPGSATAFYVITGQKPENR